ncbi:hypothetical protein UFOVP707_14 [uncultured Caudovirales phage]|uniref:Uncharacterized protein n=1 Tax=uncultured Caudovirales phage TaxID=2100421 RepID=A0A6J5NMH1_9CAUD|nr:hypothetical protein UFOVP707_14 [uncultured Caudovirales phage]
MTQAEHTELREALLRYRDALLRQAVGDLFQRHAGVRPTVDKGLLEARDRVVKAARGMQGYTLVEVCAEIGWLAPPPPRT